MPKKSVKDESKIEELNASEPTKTNKSLAKKAELVEEKPKKGATKKAEPVEEKVVEEKPKKGAAKKPEPVEEKVVEEKPKKGAAKKPVEEKVVEEKPKKGTVKKPEPVEEKPKKGTAKKPEPVEEKVTDDKVKKIIKKQDVNKEIVEDDEKYKEMVSELHALIVKMSDHNIKGAELVEKRDTLVSKMDKYLHATKGTMVENILETSTKIKKPITKLESTGIVDEDESDSDSSDNDDSDEDTDDDATPAEPLKKGKQPIKFNGGKKPKDDDSSDSD